MVQRKPQNPPEGMTGKHVLIINGAETRLQIVLGRAGELVQAREISAPGKILRFLVPSIQEIMDGHVIGPGDIGGICCVCGPGSFTGIRLVLATAFGLARGWNVPLAGIDYLPLLAAGAGELLSGELWVVTHARQGQVYLQSFAAPSGRPMHDPISPSLQEVRDRLQAREHPPAVLGSGVRKNPSFWQEQGSLVRILDPLFDVPRPEILLDHAFRASYAHDPVAPLYMRRSDAEENLEAICARRGVSVVQAREKIPDFTQQVDRQENHPGDQG